MTQDFETLHARYLASAGNLARARRRLDPATERAWATETRRFEAAIGALVEQAGGLDD